MNNMEWIKLTLETTTEATDLVSATLAELGIEGIEIEDKIPLSEEDKSRLFIDILPELGEDDGVALISFYVDPDTDIAVLSEEVQSALDELAGYTELGSRKLTISKTEDKDWINNWKEFFKPFRVDESIVIKPTWETLSEVREGDCVVEIDPGTAFGTGSHETTKLCILNIKKYMKPGALLLDVGCGSGILSIIGMKLGAKEAIGIDIDENAARTSVENAAVNSIPVGYVEDADKNGEVKGIDGGITFMSGNVITDGELRGFIGRGKYDVVVANILADIIIPLSEVAAEFMKPDGLFISSGIIYMKQDEVCEALEKNGFKIVEICEMGEWRSIVARIK